MRKWKNGTSYKPAKINRALLHHDIPTLPGLYYWDAYKQNVELYRKGRCKRLFVTPPIRGAVEIRVTPRIAGTFSAVAPVANDPT